MNTLTLTRCSILEGHEGTIHDIDWSPEGELLASASRDGTVRIWDGTLGVTRTVCRGHTSWVKTVAWSPDGERLASGSKDQTVRVWNRGGLPLQEFALDNHVESLAWASDGSMIASAARGGGVRLLNLVQPDESFVLGHHEGTATSVTWLAAPDLVLTGGSDGTVRVWRYRERSLGRILEFGAAVRSVSASASGTFVAIAFGDHSIQVIETSKWLPIALLESHSGPITHVRFSRTGDLLCTQSSNGEGFIWESRSWSKVAQVRMPKTHAALNGLAISPASPMLASLLHKNRAIQIWRADFGANESRAESSQADQPSGPLIDALAKVLPEHAQHGPTTIVLVERDLVMEKTEKHIEVNTGRQANVIVDSAGAEARQEIHNVQANRENADKDLSDQVRRLRTLLENIQSDQEQEAILLRQRLDEIDLQLGQFAKQKKPHLLKLSAKGLLDAARAVGDIVPGLLSTAERISETIARLS